MQLPEQVISERVNAGVRNALSEMMIGNITLNVQLQASNARVAELEAKYEPKKKDK